MTAALEPTALCLQKFLANFATVVALGGIPSHCFGKSSRDMAATLREIHGPIAASALPISTVANVCYSGIATAEGQISFAEIF